MEEHQVTWRVLLVLLALAALVLLPPLFDAVSGAFDADCPPSGGGLDTPGRCP